MSKQKIKNLERRALKKEVVETPIFVFEEEGGRAHSNLRKRINKLKTRSLSQ